MTYAFDLFLAEFKYSDMWKAMVNTVEASPWHREANVAVHTEMAIEQYRTRFAPFRSGLQNTIALTALLFHDVGKPAAEEVLEKKDGSGKYRRYAGHEQDSAVAFSEEYVRNKQLRALINPQHARMVRWIIEHHLPYGLKQPDKVNSLRTAMWHTLRDMEETFYDCLRSDSAGRISDDHEQKLANVEAWIKQFKAVPVLVDDFEKYPRAMYVLIGPSGSGKSTWTAAHCKAGDVVISLDMMRLEFLALSGAALAEYQTQGEAYAHAWEYANANATGPTGFNIFVQHKTNELMQLAKTNNANVFVDNVNGSRKSRAQWVQLGRNHGLTIVAVEFWNTLDTLIARQKTRGDKEVPAAAVKQHQYAMTCAWLGAECEDIVLVIGVTS